MRSRPARLVRYALFSLSAVQVIAAAAVSAAGGGAAPSRSSNSAAPFAQPATPGLYLLQRCRSELRATKSRDHNLLAVGQPSSPSNDQQQSGDDSASLRSMCSILHVSAVVTERLDPPAAHLRRCTRPQSIRPGAAGAPVERVARQKLHVGADRCLGDSSGRFRRGLDTGRIAARGTISVEEFFHDGNGNR